MNKIDDLALSIKNNIKTILMDFAVAVVSVAYVLYQMLTLEPTKLNPLVLIGQAIIGIIAGVLVKMALGENGFTKGYRSKKWELSLFSYSKKADMALPYIDNVDKFYDKERAEKTMRNRKTRLAGVRLKYDDFFDEQGNYKGQEIMPKWKYQREIKKDKDYKLPENTVVLDLKQRRTLNKAIAIKIYIRNIFSEYDINNRTDEQGEQTDAQVKSMNLKKNILTASAIAMVGVYFVPNWVWDLGHFVWGLLQVALWITFGIVQLYNNYYFITETKTGYLKLKEVDLSKFIITYAPQGKEKLQEMTQEKPATEQKDQPKQEQQVEIMEITQEEFEKMKGTK